ncbi:MAG: methylated-DNA--[protein]-cysteine S-methyltransferase [Thermoleophilia bacterium]|nr:methylated-DNA--[protein]-cysteine S-methyltransferase [Thermoleophilia bacterium]
MTFDALLARSTDTFTQRALHHELVDVAVADLDTVLGRLFVAATPAGIVQVAFAEVDRDELLADLAAKVSPRVLEAPSDLLDDARRQLDEYLHGARRAFDLPVDLQLARGEFRHAVLAQLPNIAYGSTWNYAELAAAAGRPNAVRAAGSGCATNPVPIVVPCHRVLRTGGALGGYAGGLDRKAWLLELEQRAE